MTEKKLKIKAALYTPIRDMEIEGRFLGVLDQEKFAALIHTKKIQSKLFTSSSVSIKALTEEGDLTGKRIAIAVKMIDGEYAAKQLFISDQLSGIAHKHLKRIDVTTKDDGDWLSLEEVD